MSNLRPFALMTLFLVLASCPALPALAGSSKDLDHYRSALIRAREGDNSGAVELFRKMTGPLQPWADLQLARALVKKGDLEQAEASIRASLGATGEAAAHGSLQIELSRVLEKRGDFTGAAEALDMALAGTQLAKAELPILKDQARLWKQAGERSRYHLSLLNASMLRGGSSPAKQFMVDQLLAEQKSGRAAGSFSDPIQAVRWARFLERKKLIPQALSALPLAPTTSGTLRCDLEIARARYESRLGRRDLAANRLTDLANDLANPDSSRAEALLLLGRVHRASKHWDLARRSFQSIVDIEPASSRAATARIELARIADRQGKKSEAEILRQHVLREQAGTLSAAELSWERGRALFRDRKYREAAAVLEVHVKNHSRRRLGMSARYWHALSLFKAGKGKQALRQLSRDQTAGIYRDFASSRLAGGRPKLLRPRARWPRKRRFKVLPDRFLKLPEGPVAEQSVLLLAARDWESLVLLLEWGRRQHPRSYAIRNNLSLAYQGLKRPRAALQVAEEASNATSELEGLRQDDLDRLLYPVPFEETYLEYCREWGVSPHLALAISREESHFQQDIQSWADARGVMQIIPSTGRWIAGKLGMGKLDISRLYERNLNIRMGCWYLRHVTDMYKEYLSPELLAMAAYNGGPGNVRKWLRKRSSLPMDEFIEQIPLLESRWYVKKVGRSLLAYERIYGK